MNKTFMPLLLSVLLFPACSAPVPREGLPINKNEYKESLNSEDNENKELYYRTTTVSGAEDIKPLSKVFAEEDALKHLKAMNFSLHKDFDFYELGTQPLYCMEKYHGDLKFVDASNADVVNQELNLESGQAYSTPLRSIQMDEKIFSAFADKIKEGEGFSVEDFCIKNAGDEINVILGSEYREYYSLNDTLTLDFYSKMVTLRVKGFLEPGAVLKSGYYGRDSLDCCIIMPYISTEYEPADEDEARFQKILYSQKNEGLVRASAPDEFEELHGRISKLAEENGLLLELFSEPFSIEY